MATYYVCSDTSGSGFVVVMNDGDFATVVDHAATMSAAQKKRDRYRDREAAAQAKAGGK